MPLSKSAAHRKDLSGKPATFTHQHFRKVAEVIRGLPDDIEAPEYSTGMFDCRARVAAHFADALAVTNPNFDRHRFLMACQSTEN